MPATIGRSAPSAVLGADLHNHLVLVTSFFQSPSLFAGSEAISTFHAVESLDRAQKLYAELSAR
jgi:hypothetical protein